MAETARRHEAVVELATAGILAAVMTAVSVILGAL